MKFKLIYSALILLSLANCAQSDDLVIDENQEGLFYWDQTACFDPWDTNQFDSDDKTSRALKEYLREKSIDPIEIGFKNILEEGQSICDACHCPTGTRIIVRVEPSDYSEIESLGFAKLTALKQHILLEYKMTKTK